MTSIGLGDTPFPVSAHNAPTVFSGRSVVTPAGSLAVRACALAAAVAALLLFLGLNPFVAALSAGFLAVTFSQRTNPVATRPGAGARLGALSALLLFCIAAILETAAVVFLHKGAEIHGQVMEKIQQAAARYPGSDIQPFMDFVSSPQGFAFLVGASLIFGLVAFVVLGGVGGVVSAGFSGRRKRK